MDFHFISPCGAKLYEVFDLHWHNVPGVKRAFFGCIWRESWYNSARMFGGGFRPMGERENEEAV